jgi:hypothetical protein
MVDAASSDPLLLTDDEVIALAADRGVLWPAGLPSVDVDVPEAVSAATFRGNRALVARGLRTDDGSSSAETVALAVLTATHRTTVELVDDDGSIASYGISSAHHRTPDGRWCFEVVTPLGIHQLAIVPVEDHAAYLRALIEAAVSAGPQTSGWLRARSEGAVGSVAVVARGDALLVRRSDEEPAAVTVDAALELLLPAS